MKLFTDFTDSSRHKEKISIFVFDYYLKKLQFKKVDFYQKELSIGISAIKKGSSLAQAVAKGFLSENTLEKKDRSPVTVADYGVQTVVMSEIRKAFKDSLFVAEEDSSDLEDPSNRDLLEKLGTFVQEQVPGLNTDDILKILKTGQHGGGSEGAFWTLDPIDGTKGFIRRQQYALALAYIVNGEVVLGILACPNLPVTGSNTGGSLYYGVKDQGAFMMDLSGGERTSIFCQKIDDPNDANFCESVESGHSSHECSQKIAELLGVNSPPLRMDSQCKYATVARGEASIYLRLPTNQDYEEKIWDHAAGALIVQEAGGLVDDINGKPLDFSSGKTLKANRGVVASCAGINDAIKNAVKNVLHKHPNP